MNCFLSVSISLIIATAILTSPCAAFGAATDIPPASVKIPPMVAEESVSTFVPSEAAPGSGIAVNVIYPAKTRYKEGAPVVVVVPGGHGPEGLGFTMHAAQSGFTEVRFAFPGGGKKGLDSGGIYDNRGLNSQMVLKDVLLFAAGKLADMRDRKIGQIVPVKLYNSTVGIAAWSNGGNIAAVTLAKHTGQLGFVGWLAFYESPLGALFYPPNLGGMQDLILNRHYRPGSCATGACLVDYRKLWFQKEARKSPGAHRKLGEPEVPGVLFFDENRDGRWQEPFEFAFSYATDVEVDKQFYPPQVTHALRRLGVFDKLMAKPKDKETALPGKGTKTAAQPAEASAKAGVKPAATSAQGLEIRSNKTAWRPPQRAWLETVATPAESEAYFEERDGSLYIPDLCKKLPDCLIGIVATRLDHLQRQSDHPHIALQYNAWLANKARFVRLNPDPQYVFQVSGLHAASFIDNKPNSSIDAADMAAHMEPEGFVPDYVYVEAAIAELSDRKKSRNLTETLKAPLTTYSNGALPPPEKPKAAGSAK